MVQTIKMLSVAAVIGLLSVPAVMAQSQQGKSPYDQGGIQLSPGRNNCNTPTGCANYPSGNVSKDNPLTKQEQGMGAGGDISPAKSNCGPDDATCANYPTGSQTKSNPSQPQH